ncbi:MAG TPA: tetratricopeptide repeat protein, partial [Xanthobacteraceae bacterium]|nr:tetratricopeptide repeat protein [Xanthobacteraceae bacterium]
AEERYRQVLRLAPESAQIQLNLATLLGERGRYQEALEIAQKVRNRRPNMMRAQSLVTEFEDILKRRDATQRQMKRTGANRPK